MKKFASLALLLLGCTLFIKPKPKLLFVEEAQGQYTYKDSQDTFSDRFTLFAYEDKLAIDLYAYNFPVAFIRHNRDSTLAYFPLERKLLILGKDDCLPLEGWQVPIAALALAYTATLPEDKDSTQTSGDTLIIWKEGTAYLQLKENQRLISLKGKGWVLYREGEFEKMPARARRIVFKLGEAEFALEFTSLVVSEREPEKLFTLYLTEGIIDYR